MLHSSGGPAGSKFDALRGWAALVVLAAHVYQVFLLPQLGDGLVAIVGTFAKHAVLLFFLLSGYLITQSIKANIRKNGRFDHAEYVVHRIARIYPPLIGSIAVVLACWALAAGGRLVVTPMDVPNVLLMRNGMVEANEPLWSLYIEFTIYFVAMFAAMGRGWLLAALLFFLYGMRVNENFAFYAAAWCFGSVAALGLLNNRIAAALGGATLVLVVLLDPRGLLVDEAALSVLAQLGACLCYVALFTWNFRPIWSSSGAFSYSLYIIHFPLLLFAHALTSDWIGASVWHSLAVAGLSAVAIVLAARVFAQYLEDQRRFRPWVRALLARRFP
jgi:peptidoglycan/LPS O-acetylase OafA/YrhL